MNAKRDMSAGDAEDVELVDFYMDQAPAPSGEAGLQEAAGVIACLHACLNHLDQINLREFSILYNFDQSIRKVKSPKERGELFANSEQFRDLHEKFAQAHPVPAAARSVPYHWYCFIRTPDNKLLELDGAKKGPVAFDLPCLEGELLRAVREVIQDRVRNEDIDDYINVMTLNEVPQEIILRTVDEIKERM